jgi:hypothetical protein
VRATRAAALAAFLLLTCAGAASAATVGDEVSVTLDRPKVETRLGQEFGFTSVVRNEIDRPLTGLIAHLNVLSTDPDVYVDPEDWSSERTQFLAPLGPGESVQLPWRVKAVNSGELVAYVAVTSSEGSQPVVASAPLRLTVTEKRTINAGGVLPVALGMPVAAAVLMGVAARRRRQLSRPG